MTKRRTAAEIIATYINYDMAEMSEYRYQPARYFSPAIYAIGETYYCAPTNGKLHNGWNWTFAAMVLDRKVFTAGTEIAD